ncbi:unnamed protein product [Psylliodes chrysocephalus]|uniref:Peptidoglycan-recognition protein n=1 Tax=Psylliodes chrysocephalus TaxID=3402493 RepID=A0A9P0D4P3_9CUCU|nr:unnamed protein product [Psylliodes chrysocephala]
MWNVWLVVFFLCFAKIQCDDCPPIITRADWNASDPKEIKPLSINPPPYVLVHHSATQSCFTVEACKRLVKSIQNVHMNTNGWEDIGYNFLIGGDGSIYEGRGWGIHGAHAIKYNARSIGICLLGNFQEQTPPEIQTKSLNELVSCAKQTEKVEDQYHLIGHRQASATLCPGTFLFKIVQGLPQFDPHPQ